jgi:hypothetical protein
VVLLHHDNDMLDPTEVPACLSTRSTEGA